MTSSANDEDNADAGDKEEEEELLLLLGLVLLRLDGSITVRIVVAGMIR